MMDKRRVKTRFKIKGEAREKKQMNNKKIRILDFVSDNMKISHVRRLLFLFWGY
jgi:ribosomal protein S18